MSQPACLHVLQVSSTLEGVQLGQFITKTHRGRVFRGVYNGEAVTIKVGPPSNPCMMRLHDALTAQVSVAWRHTTWCTTEKLSKKIDIEAHTEEFTMSGRNNCNVG